MDVVVVVVVVGDWSELTSAVFILWLPYYDGRMNEE